MFATYRDPRQAARLRLEELLADVAAERPARELWVRVGAARAARIAFGVVGLIGALAVVQAAIPVAQATFGGRGCDSSGALSRRLLFAWAAAGAAWLVARIAGPLIAQRAMRVGPPTGDVEGDLARLGARAPVPRPERWGFAAVALPMLAICLLAPLTLHLAFWALFLREPATTLGDFDPWILYGLGIVGHAHLVLAVHATIYAHRLVNAPVAEVEGVGGASRALGMTVFASAFPGVIFFGVPPVLTAVTCALFVPALFAAMRRVVSTERKEMSAAARG